jgi:ketosteroid isomerase-like protein
MTAEGESLIRRAYAAFAERDLDRLVAISAEDVEVSTVTGLLAGRTEPYRGYAGLAEYLEDLAGQWKRLELQPQTFHPLGAGRTLVFGRVRAWHERGFLDSQNAWLWTLADDKVKAVRVYADPGDARRAFTDPDASPGP